MGAGLAPRSTSSLSRPAVAAAIVAAFFSVGLLSAGGLGGAFEGPASTPSPQFVDDPGPPRASAPAGDEPSPAAPRPRACDRPSLIGTVESGEVAARKAPNQTAPVVARFGPRNVLGAPQVFLLEKEVFDSEGRPWYQALLPIRPNGTRGYVPGDALGINETSYRMELVREEFRLVLFKGCRVVKIFTVGIGTGRTPTPVGKFYIASLLKLPVPDSVYGTYAYGLSGYSKVLRDWALGGIIGLHGTNQPSSVGTRASHGCIRMHNVDIEHLVRILPLGTPIEVS
jgi:L,D-transpeptidase catalytic domain